MGGPSIAGPRGRGPPSFLKLFRQAERREATIQVAFADDRGMEQ